MEEQLERLKEELASLSGIKECVAQLQNQQTRNDELAREIQILKNQNREQREMLETIRPRQTQTVNNDETLVSGLVASLQRTHIDVNIPEFFDEESSNPIEFLDNMESYFNLKNIVGQWKLGIIENKLRGRAKLWWSSIKHQIESYDAFERTFLEKFYSIPIQVKAKNRWSSRKYKSQDGSLQMYFFKQIVEAKYFTPKLDVFEVNYTIIQQLPNRIRDILATVNFSDTKQIEQTLSQLDSTYQERENEKRQNQNSSNPINQSQNFRNTTYKYNDSQYINYQPANNQIGPQSQINYQNYSHNNSQVANTGNVMTNGQSPNNFSASTNNHIILPNLRYPPPPLLSTHHQVVGKQGVDNVINTNLK
ncbi:uncharacterized protein LOC124302493 [Neodiprion virginianus]|uniref:uncharacterized protein LOC124302493 n=1 Tax=Neodiprion virginianus TaxID=2961670 RepID=UPI001EE71615|nr:uncharacterized protein LOC124302493 [Neodiprion virginianus]